MNMPEMKGMSDPSEIDMMISALQKIRQTMGERSAKHIGPKDHEMKIEIMSGGQEDPDAEMENQEGKTLDDIPSPEDSKMNKKGNNNANNLFKN
jgi:hypothetical protein